MFRDRETRQVLLCALKVLTKTFDGLTGLIVPVAEYFNKAGHSIHVALVLGIMLCGKNVRRKRLEIRLTFQLVTSFMVYANIVTFPTYFATSLMKGQV